MTRTAKHDDPTSPTRGVGSLFLFGFAALGVLAIAVAAFVILRDGGTAPAGASLPKTSDYHALLVDPADANRLVLGTHQGLFTSVDGGRRWEQSGLADQDAMHLAQPTKRRAWAAGHDVLATSTDGGSTWSDVRPTGLPSLDIHGFAIDARDAGTLLAAVAGAGLYRSADGGRSFGLLSSGVGGAVMALASLPNGDLLAGDMSRESLLLSSDKGTSWRSVLDAPIMGIAVDPRNPRRLLAAGAGVFRSVDGGRTWTRVLALRSGAGPVAWAPAAAGVAYVVGFDRSLHRSSDGGATWTTVVRGEGI